MRTHPEVGAGILADIDTWEDVRLIVRHHHEHFNGGGYPDGLRYAEIPLGARIVSVVDAFDVMRTGPPVPDGPLHRVEPRRAAPGEWPPVRPGDRPGPDGGPARRRQHARAPRRSISISSPTAAPWSAAGRRDVAIAVVAARGLRASMVRVPRAGS